MTARGSFMHVGTLVWMSILLCASLGPALAQVPAGGDERVEVISSKLPPRETPAYKRLLSLAGKSARGQLLTHSRAEMWSMPADRLHAVMAEAEKLGVRVVKLGPDWNSVLMPHGKDAAMTASQEAMMGSIMRAKETMSVKMMVTPDPTLLEYALTKDMQGRAIGQPPPQGAISRILIPLNESKTLSVRRTAIDVRPNGYTWRGAIEETSEPVMIMWWKTGQFNGMFTYRGRMYALRNLGGDVHAVVEADSAKMPPDHGAMRPKPDMRADELAGDPMVKSGEAAVMRERQKDLDERRDSITPAPPTPAAGKSMGGATETKVISPLPPMKRAELARKPVTIDVMVLYTEGVKKDYIDVDQDLIALAIEQGNAAFANSGTGNIKLRLVHSQLVNYDESNGQHFGHLYKMVDAKDVFQPVRALRNEKKADIVALIVDDPSGCGLSTRVAASEDEAYVVVHHSCAALSYSLAHEIGHIIGARHDRGLDDNMAPFPYGHGFVNGTKWRDIMSYESSCNGCPRVPFWSNPTVNFMGVRGGSVDTDNARVLLEQAERVSRFR